MALITIDNFEKTEKNNKLHNTIVAKYSISNINGELYFQIDTYGSNDRENPDKVSQSIQFDKDMAQHLINLLKYHFRTCLHSLFSKVWI